MKVDQHHYHNGASQIAQFCWTMLCFQAYFTYASIAKFGTKAIWIVLLKVLVMVFLCLRLYHGGQISKWILVTMLSVGSLMFLGAMDFKNWFSTALFGMYAYIYLHWTYMLIFSPEINYYLQVRNRMREEMSD